MSIYFRIYFFKFEDGKSDYTFYIFVLLFAKNLYLPHLKKKNIIDHVCAVFVDQKETYLYKLLSKKRFNQHFLLGFLRL